MVNWALPWVEDLRTVEKPNISERGTLDSITDMTPRERWIFAPLVVMTILLGVYPSLVTDIIGPSVEALISNYETALVDAESATKLAAATE